jgi:hypothetical protein
MTYDMQQTGYALVGALGKLGIVRRLLLGKVRRESDRKWGSTFQSVLLRHRSARSERDESPIPAAIASITNDSGRRPRV